MLTDDTLKYALEHSRELFILHSGQRTASLNYYFLAIAVLLSGFGVVANSSSLSTASRALIGALLSIAGLVLTNCFRGLDKRNAQLIACDEKLLTCAEAQMAALAGRHEWNITTSTDDIEPRNVRYEIIVPRIFFLYTGLSTTLGIYAIWPWANQLFCR